MRLFPTTAWRYAALLIVLFAIVALAAMTIIESIQEQAGANVSAEAFRHLSASVWALTMGCLFLAGGLGLWAIRASAESEGRRRIGRFVDTMDYLRDGLVALDAAGRVRGANPAARALFQSGAESHQPRPLRELFECLSEDDLERILDPLYPCELERLCPRRGGRRILRFRSQPSEGLMLALISDITGEHFRRLRQRQVYHLQLTGRLAAGVAHDFNNILCAISGHAALLQRLRMDPQQAERSLSIIVDETRKGVTLSRQLLELSRAGVESVPSERLADNVNAAAGLLRIALPPFWSVRARAGGRYAPVLMSESQIEQILLNLGLLAADAQAGGGTLSIVLAAPGDERLFDVDRHFAAVILVGGVAAPSPAQGEDREPGVGDGVILSVVRALLHEAHGQIDQVKDDDSAWWFRVCLAPVETGDDPGGVESGVHLLSRRRVVLAGFGDVMDRAARRAAK